MLKKIIYDFMHPYLPLLLNQMADVVSCHVFPHQSGIVVETSPRNL